MKLTIKQRKTCMTVLTAAPNTFLLKAVNEAKGTLEGYASLYNIEDSDADIVAPGAFELSLQEWQKQGRQPPLLWQHDPAQPIGVWQMLRSDATGLYVRGQLFVAEIAKAAEAYALLKRGALSGLSIGYRPEVARRDAKRGVRILERIKLYEISLVTFPALEAARVSAVKSQVSDEAALVAELRQLEEAFRSAMPASTLST
jgi:HK97 family phage prohead protease